MYYMMFESIPPLRPERTPPGPDYTTQPAINYNMSKNLYPRSVPLRENPNRIQPHRTAQGVCALGGRSEGGGSDAPARMRKQYTHAGGGQEITG